METENIEGIWSDWKIEERIGEGTSGKVYKAKRENFNQTFYSAIKVITIPKNGEQAYLEDGLNKEELIEYYKEYVNDILKEVTLLEELKGAKNILNIEDCKVIEDKEKLQWKIYLRMDYLKNAKKYFFENPPREIDIINLGIDICEALQNCEKVGIVHGNIKPENIFVSKFKEYKLGDFILAQKIGTESTMMNKNDYLFSSPEVYRNYAPDNTADIYALGMVMYYLLNHNRVPFMPEYPNKITLKDRNQAMLQRVNGEEIPKTSNMSNELYTILKKMCSYKKEDRYQTAEELKQDLKKIQKEEEKTIEDSYEKTVSIFSKRRQQRLEQEENKIEDKEEHKQEEIEKKETKLENAEQTKVNNEEIIQDENEAKENENIEEKEHIHQETEKQEVKEPIKRENQKTKNKKPIHKQKGSKKKPPKRRNKRKLNKKAIGTIVAVIIIGGIIFISQNQQEEQEKPEQEQKVQVVVPRVVDMKFDAAQNILQQIGFTVEKEEIETTEKESGTVISQSIESNTMVEEGTIIKLQVVK